MQPLKGHFLNVGVCVRIQLSISRSQKPYNKLPVVVLKINLMLFVSILALPERRKIQVNQLTPMRDDDEGM